MKQWSPDGAQVVWTGAAEGHLAAGWLEQPERWLMLQQVHGNDVVTATAETNSGLAGDAWVSDQPGVVMGIKTADCAPVAIVGRNAAAAVHAGWLGLVTGVIAAAVEQLRAFDGGVLRAGLGPCIHPCCYEFGAAELERVSTSVGSSVTAVASSGNSSLDVPAAVRAQLAACGVELDYEDADCTACSGKYFSHRVTGTKDRQVMFVKRS